VYGLAGRLRPTFFFWDYGTTGHRDYSIFKSNVILFEKKMGICWISGLEQAKRNGLAGVLQGDVWGEE